MTDVSTAQAKLDRHYKSLEADWTVTDRSATYRSLVTSSDNAKTAFHRWFHLKEAFAHDLLANLRADELREGVAADWSTVLDPFSGGGTTLLSALMLETASADSIFAGTERNAALRVIAQAKLMGYCLPSADMPEVLRAARALDFSPSSGYSTESATLNNERFFNQTDVSSLLSVREQLRAIEDEPARTILECVLLSSVEAVGRVRRDGRALRFDDSKKPVTPEQAFARRLKRVEKDVLNRVASVVPTAAPSVQRGDARTVDELMPGRSGAFERIVFSPPYPNNIDYTEVYKMENWVLGEWSTAADMREQRLSTLRSHPSVLFPETYGYLDSPAAAEFAALVDPLSASVSDDRYTRGRRQLIRGYVDDMRAVLVACRRLVAQKGRLYCVVGNSVHGDVESGFVVAADVLIGRIGELTGWRVAEIRVARVLTRRSSNSPYVRESIVILEPA